MPPLTPDSWGKIRAGWETGETGTALAARFGVSPQVVCRKAKREGWARSETVAEEVKDRAAAKLRKSAVSDPEERDAIIDAKADELAELCRKHVHECKAARAMMYDGYQEVKAGETKKVRDAGWEKLKSAKIMSETLRIIQEIEINRYHLSVKGKGDERKQIVIHRSYGL